MSEEHQVVETSRRDAGKAEASAGRSSCVGDVAATVAKVLGASEHVVFGYLFGSQASGRTHTRSDVDVAVWLREPYDRTAIAPPARVAYDLTVALGRRDVDVVVLNEASLWMAARILRGTLLVDKDEALRIRTEAAIMSRYHDRLPYYRRHIEIEGGRLAESGYS